MKLITYFVSILSIMVFLLMTTGCEDICCGTESTIPVKKSVNN